MLRATQTYATEHVEAGAQTPPMDRSPRESRWATAILVGALAPALAAIWAVPWFVPQDAPAHVYNAQVLLQSFDPASSSRDVYTVKWQPIPNWAGPLALAGLVAILPAWVADRIMTSLTLVSFAAAVFWLRWRVAGARGLRVAALLAALLAMNIAWLFGFASFMLGACLFPITLGLWWPARDRLSIPRLTALAVLLMLGYFCHLVSLGLTVGGLFVLAVASPVSNGRAMPRHPWFSRLARTCATFMPVVFLGKYYLAIATQRAPMRPQWDHLSNLWSPWAWIVQFEWVDPISLAIRDGLPMTERFGLQFGFFAPVIWLAAAIVLWWYGTMSAGLRSWVQADRRGWLLLAAILMIGGAVGPDSLGDAHGDYLPQRIVLIGLVALVPIFDVDPSRWCGRICTTALVLAVGLQTAVIWDYALYSNRTAGQMIRAGEAIGHNQRIATLLVSTRSRFRSNPLLHADNWLGVDSGNVVWSNYETRHYYFPVHFRPEIKRPDPADLEWISIHEGPSEAEERAGAWERILSQHAESIDVVVVWKSDPALDSITSRWFDRVDRRGDVQIFRRGTLKPNAELMRGSKSTIR
jgi:hypothetical protein